MWQSDIYKQYIYIKGVSEEQRWMSSDIDVLFRLSTEAEDEALRSVYAFLVEWFSSSSTIEVQTSGSTGAPKRIKVDKQQMMRSAIRTCEFLGLKQGDTAMLCMDMRYIGAKMMVVRALVGGLKLVVRTPSGHPLNCMTESVDFLSIVPLQLYNTMNVPAERARLNAIPYIIVGGGAVDESICEALKGMSCKVYSTYGMTETLSHVALRPLNGTDASECFLPLPGVKVTLASKGTLVINDTLLDGKDIVTNDVGKVFPDGTFVVCGRADNVVNSGGVKIQLEEDEVLLRTFIDVPFALTSVKDVRLGEALVLLVDKRYKKSDTDLLDGMKKILSQYHIPKYIFRLEAIPMSGNAKLNRHECQKLAEEMITQKEAQ